MPTYKPGDIVLVASPAGDCIPNVHVRLKKKIVVKPTKGKRVGLRMTMDWPGYTGWEAEMVYQDEIDMLRKEWNIPFKSPGDGTFVYERLIIKKPRKRKKQDEKIIKNSKNSPTVIRRRKKK